MHEIDWLFSTWNVFPVNTCKAMDRDVVELDIKSWFRDLTCSLKNHSNPHAFRFKLNELGEVEMTYRNWAVTKKKE